MSRDREIINYLMEIKEDVASLKQQLSDYPELKDNVKRIEQEIAEATSALKTLRWLAGVLFVVAPTSVYAYIRIKAGI